MCLSIRLVSCIPGKIFSVPGRAVELERIQIAFPLSLMEQLSGWVETFPLLAWVSALCRARRLLLHLPGDVLELEEAATVLGMCPMVPLAFCPPPLTVLLPQWGLALSKNPLSFALSKHPRSLSSPQPLVCRGSAERWQKKSHLPWASDCAVNVRTLLQQLVAPWLPALRRKGVGLGMFMQWRERLVCWERRWWGHEELDTPTAPSGTQLNQHSSIPWLCPLGTGRGWVLEPCAALSFGTRRENLQRENFKWMDVGNRVGFVLVWIFFFKWFSSRPGGIYCKLRTWLLSEK